MYVCMYVCMFMYTFIGIVFAWRSAHKKSCTVLHDKNFSHLSNNHLRMTLDLAEIPYVCLWTAQQSIMTALNMLF